MAAPIPLTEPDSITPGDTAKWLRCLADYPASASWALSYTLANAAQRYTFNASADGDDHLVTVSAATTNGWVAGSYAWRAQVAKSDEVFTVGTGTVTVLPNFATAIDARSHARKVLSNIEAYLENPNNITASNYEIAGRSLQRFGIPELLKLRDRYRAEVAREDNAAAIARGLPDRRRILVRFGP